MNAPTLRQLTLRPGTGFRGLGTALTEIHKCQQRWPCLGCAKCKGPPTNFMEWYERFCDQAPAMSTKELMQEAFNAGFNHRIPPSTNLKRGCKISKKELDKLISYAKDCGFQVKTTLSKYAAESARCATYTIDHPSYEYTPLAESCMDKETRRWTHWMFIRL